MSPLWNAIGICLSEIAWFSFDKNYLVQLPLFVNVIWRYTDSVLVGYPVEMIRVSQLCLSAYCVTLTVLYVMGLVMSVHNCAQIGISCDRQGKKNS